MTRDSCCRALRASRSCRQAQESSAGHGAGTAGREARQPDGGQSAWVSAAADASAAGGAPGSRQTAPGVSVILQEELSLGALIGEGGFGKARACPPHASPCPPGMPVCVAFVAG